MNPALKRRGLSLPLRTDLIGSRLATERDNRLHDGSHRDVLGGIPVSVTGIATVLACKVGLTLVILPRNKERLLPPRLQRAGLPQAEEL